MTAIFRFCIFPVIILGILLIAAEFLLFDTNPNAVIKFDSVGNEYFEDSLVFRKKDTLYANESVLNPIVNDYKLNFHKPDHLLQSSDSRNYSSDNYKSGNMPERNDLNAGHLAFESGLKKRNVCVKGRQVQGKKQKGHCDTNTVSRSHLSLYKDSLAYSDEIHPALPCPSDLIHNKSVMPLSDAIFDNMHYTVKNKVEPNSDFYLYPDSDAGKLIIAARNWENIESMQLFTITGKSVYKVEVPQKEIDIRNLTNGMYVLIVASKNGSQNSQRIVINKD